MQGSRWASRRRLIVLSWLDEERDALLHSLFNAELAQRKICKSHEALSSEWVASLRCTADWQTTVMR